RFAVKIGRTRYEGPVFVQALFAPGYVSIPSITVPADKSEGEMEASVSDDALTEGLPLTKTLTINARASTAFGVRPANEKLDLDLGGPPANRGISVSPLVEIHQAGQCRFVVKLARAGFLGPIRLDFGDVPDDVMIPPVEIPAGTAEMEVD